jgi:hypothetical protein
MELIDFYIEANFNPSEALVSKCYDINYSKIIPILHEAGFVFSRRLFDELIMNNRFDFVQQILPFTNYLATTSLVVDQGAYKLLELLYTANRLTDLPSYKILLLSISKGRLDIVKLLYRHIFAYDVNTMPYYWAVQYNNVEILKFLLQRLPYNALYRWEESINITTEQAIRGGNIEILKLLTPYIIIDDYILKTLRGSYTYEIIQFFLDNFMQPRLEPLRDIALLNLISQSSDKVEDFLGKFYEPTFRREYLPFFTREYTPMLLAYFKDIDSSSLIEIYIRNSMDDELREILKTETMYEGTFFRIALETERVEPFEIYLDRFPQVDVADITETAYKQDKTKIYNYLRYDRPIRSRQPDCRLQ